MKILLVDDNAGLRGLVASILERNVLGLSELIRCENGVQAVESYSYEPSDWVVLDIQMPLMNGLEAAKRIKEMDHSARIILMTQYNEPEYQEKAEDIGICGFVQKDDLMVIPEIINR